MDCRDRCYVCVTGSKVAAKVVININTNYIQMSSNTWHFGGNIEGMHTEANKEHKATSKQKTLLPFRQKPTAVPSVFIRLLFKPLSLWGILLREPLTYTVCGFPSHWEAICFGVFANGEQMLKGTSGTGQPEGRGGEDVLSQPSDRQHFLRGYDFLDCCLH